MTVIDTIEALQELAEAGYGDCKVFIHTSETETSTLLPLDLVQAISETNKAFILIDPTYTEYVILK